jgi:hypothetical protein
VAFEPTGVAAGLCCNLLSETSMIIDDLLLNNHLPAEKQGGKPYSEPAAT